MKTRDTELGRYLYSVRIKNGFENVSDYLRTYELPISDAYYRDVETGRKTLSLDKAQGLSEKLPIPVEERHDILHYVIKDALPLDICNKILKPNVHETYNNLKDYVDTVQYDLSVYEGAYELVKYKMEQTFLGTEEDIAYLEDNFKYLPILHYIYLVEEASFQSIKNVATKCKLNVSDESIREFIGKICDIGATGEPDTYRRKRKIFRIPKSDSGDNFKKRFLHEEVSLSSDRNRGEPFFPEGTFEMSGIYAINPDTMKKLRKKLINFIAELDISETDLAEEDAMPFFISIITSDRNEYDGRV